MKRYWFKAKEYGWGWYPATWQGWLVLVGFIIAELLNAWRLTVFVDNPSASFISAFVIESVLLTAILLIICWKTGERPRWRWGKGT